MSDSVAGAFRNVFSAIASLTFFVALSAATIFALQDNFSQMQHMGPDFLRMPLASSQPFRRPPKPQAPVIVITPTEPIVLRQELAMTPKELLDRWKPLVKEASARFDVPATWIRAVIARESGGRTVDNGGMPITSVAGAMGIMQLMPQTYAQMRNQYNLGSDPYDPHDNIIAGTAYLHELYKRYGFPGMFAAYNDGPGNFDQHLAGKRALPAETVAYVAAVAGKRVAADDSCTALSGKRDRHSMLARLRLHCAAKGYRRIQAQLG